MHMSFHHLYFVMGACFVLSGRNSSAGRIEPVSEKIRKTAGSSENAEDSTEGGDSS